MKTSNEYTKNMKAEEVQQVYFYKSKSGKVYSYIIGPSPFKYQYNPKFSSGQLEKIAYHIGKLRRDLTDGPVLWSGFGSIKYLRNIQWIDNFEKTNYSFKQQMSWHFISWRLQVLLWRIKTVVYIFKHLFDY